MLLGINNGKNKSILIVIFTVGTWWNDQVPKKAPIPKSETHKTVGGKTLGKAQPTAIALA